VRDTYQKLYPAARGLVPDWFASHQEVAALPAPGTGLGLQAFPAPGPLLKQEAQLGVKQVVKPEVKQEAF